MQAERRGQIYLHYAEPTLRSECRNQVCLGYAEPRGVEDALGILTGLGVVEQQIIIVCW